MKIGNGDLVEIVKGEEDKNIGLRFEAGKVINSIVYGHVRDPLNSGLGVGAAVQFHYSNLEIIKSFEQQKIDKGEFVFSEIRRGDKLQVTYMNYDAEVITVGVAYRKTDGSWFTHGGAKLSSNYNKSETILLLDRQPQKTAADYGISTVLKSGGRYILTKLAEDLWSSYSLGSGNVVTRNDAEVDSFEEVDVIQEK